MAATTVAIVNLDVSSIWSRLTQTSSRSANVGQQVHDRESQLDEAVTALLDDLEAFGGLSQDEVTELRTLHLVLELNEFLDKLPSWLTRKGHRLPDDTRAAIERAQTLWRDLQSLYADYDAEDSPPRRRKGGA